MFTYTIWRLKAESTGLFLFSMPYWQTRDCKPSFSPKGKGKHWNTQAAAWRAWCDYEMAKGSYVGDGDPETLFPALTLQECEVVETVANSNTKAPNMAVLSKVLAKEGGSSDILRGLRKRAAEGRLLNYFMVVKEYDPSPYLENIGKYRVERQIVEDMRTGRGKTLYATILDIEELSDIVYLKMAIPHERIEVIWDLVEGREVQSA